MWYSLNTRILIGATVGIMSGLLFNVWGTANATVSFFVYWCDIVGQVFIDLLKMILIPLVFTSIASGIGNLKAHAQMGRVWKITLIYFLVSPALAAFLGLILVNAVRPGKGLNLSLFENGMAAFKPNEMSLAQFFKAFIDNLFMDPIKAMAQGEVLAVVLFAVILGIALIAVGEKARNLQGLLNDFFEIIMRIVGWIMQLAPFGVAGLIAKLVATQNVSLFAALGKFIAVVIGGTLFHGLVTLPLLLYIFSGVGPLRFFKGMRDALITAFSTSSSSATLPVTIRCTTENLDVDKNIVGFVAPLGATLNMDGTALYEAVAAIFIANLVGVDLNLIQQVVVFLTAILASIGAPGIPSAGMVTMVMVLQSVGLPAAAIAILLPIDRPLDALRTMVNVQGDSVCSLIVQRQIGRRKDL